jgi:hypothetical protein
MLTGFWCGNLKKRGHLKEVDNIKMALKEFGWAGVD